VNWDGVREDAMAAVLPVDEIFGLNSHFLRAWKPSAPAGRSRR
jgi:hypothetical protein